MSLTAAAVTELTVESGTKALLAEWLGDWFDGDYHSVSTTLCASLFPNSAITFDQSPISGQELDGTEIRVIVDTGKHAEHMNATGQDVTQTVSIDFWVRSRNTETGTGNSNYKADNASELLFAILQNPSCRRDLAQKGIMNIKPQKPKTYQDNNYSLRLVRCRAQLMYQVTCLP